MIVNLKELYNCLDKLFVPQGFVRKKETFYKSTEECIVFCTFDKSNLAAQYIPTMGCFYKKMVEENIEYPKYWKSGLRFNLGFLADKKLVARVFDLENHEFKDQEREMLIGELIDLYAFPFLTDVSSAEGIKMSLKKYPYLTYVITGALRAALGLSMEQ